MDLLLQFESEGLIDEGHKGSGAYIPLGGAPSCHKGFGTKVHEIG
jgi:hypothetical protein